jgi:DNA-binding MarR family transcriptional regulator
MDDAFLGSLPKRWARELPGVNAATVEIFARLSVLARQSDAFHSTVLHRYKVTHAEYVVLVTLRIVDPPHRLSPTQLGRTLRQTPAGITKTVDRLERAGLIARSPAPGDRRSLRVGLTAAGKAMAERLFSAEMTAQQACWSTLSPSQRRHVLETLRLLNRVFDSQPGPVEIAVAPSNGRRR